MSSEWIHLLALVLMIAHTVLGARGGRSVRLPELAAETVMLLAMIDSGLGIAVLAPILWLAISLVVALALVALRSGRRAAPDDGHGGAAATAHLALGLIVMALLALGMPADAEPAAASVHTHGAVSGGLVALSVGGVALLACVSVVRSAHARGAAQRVAPLLLTASAAAMAIPLAF